MSNQTMDEAAMMEAWAKAGTPNERHKALEPLVGEFTAEAKMYAGGPDAPPEVSVGGAKNEWILGGRQLRTTYKGDFCGQNFEGVGYFGFDIPRDVYVGTWMDTMCTMIMTHEGPHTGDDKVIEMRGEFINAMGQRIKDRHVTRIQDNDHHTFEMYHTGPDGNEALVGVISYTRKK